MATYLNKNGTAETYHLTERPIYGSSRLGMLREKVNMLAPVPLPSVIRTMRYGLKHYELTNHTSSPLSAGLGNVTTTLTAQKVPVYTGLNITGYKPQIVQSIDYSPFGVTRLSYSVTPVSTSHPVEEGYRYGFMNHEKDDEVKGSGNHYDFGGFGLDVRLGRRWNVDPAISEFPQWSSYSVFADNPIYFIDPDGRKFINFDANGNYTGTTKDNKWHNFWHGSKGRQTLADGGVNKFKFADPKNDVADIQSGRITKLINVNESQVKNMLIVAGAFNAANRAKPATFLGGAGVGGGAFDFSFQGIPNEFGISAPVQDANGNFAAPNIFLVDGVAHNHMNFGNFMFGAGGATLGVHLAALKLGAHKNSRFPEDGQGNRMGEDNLNGYTPQWDSSDDQFSIGEGYNFARGGGLFNRTFGGGRAWDKKKLEGNVEAGPLEGGTVVD